MDTQPSSTVQSNGSQLSQTLPGQFLGHTGYQQQPIAPISAPTLQTPILPTPDQAAAATRARMLARNPMAAPIAVPVRGQNQQYLGTISRHSGDYNVGQTPMDMAMARKKVGP